MLAEPEFAKLGHRARVLVFVRYLFCTERINDEQRGVLKDLALEGSDFLEAATELLCIDQNEEECMCVRVGDCQGLARRAWLRGRAVRGCGLM